MTTSTLLDVPGIGDKTYTLLIRQFGSLKRLSQASFDEIAALVGEKRATIVIEFFEKQ